jgi:UDP-3-O-[3-hydroxymyristoyl] glucosamine N-acyltransferase
MTTFTLADIATALGATALGDATLPLRGAAEPADAAPDQLALAMNPAYGDGLAAGQARAALVWPGADWQALGLDGAVEVPRARLGMAGVTTLFDPGPEVAPGIHPSAVIDPTANIGPNPAIGPFVTIGRDVRIGANARIAPHVSIAEGATIGDDALIHAGLRIGARVTIGDRFTAQPGGVIGADGFSFVTAEKSAVETVRETLGAETSADAQSWLRIHSIGTVEIGDDVEFGANSTIDRGTIRATTIGDGTKLDNMVHVGHNCRIGRNVLLCGQVGIAGSVEIGDQVVLGGRVCVQDNIFIGNGVIAGFGSVIMSNVPAGRAMLGYPAVPMQASIDSYKALRRLPRLARDVATLKKAVQKPGLND